MDETDSRSTGAATRRSLLRRGIAFAVSVPALAVTLDVGRASADDGDNDKDNKNKPKSAPPQPGRRLNSFRSDLSTVSQTAASGDFTSSNAGTDPLTDGRVRLRRKGNSADEGRLQIELRSAAPSVSYEVFFLPVASSKARESLGVIGPTNGKGDLNALTPTALSGMNRAGIFVVIRHDGTEAGKDEFVSSMGG